MPNRAADIMRLMQGTMGAGGAPQNPLSNNSLNRYAELMQNSMGPAPFNPMGPGPSNPQMDPRGIEQSMQNTMGAGGGQFDTNAELIEKLMAAMRAASSAQMNPGGVENMMMNTMGGNRPQMNPGNVQDMMQNTMGRNRLGSKPPPNLGSLVSGYSRGR